MSILRTPIPKKAYNRAVVPWRLNIGRELTGEELTAIAGVFLAGTKHHLLISGDVYPGLTQINGDYWATRGHGKDLAAVAKRWETVEERFPEFILDAVLEYRAPGALLDEQEVVDTVDLSESYIQRIIDEAEEVDPHVD